MPLFPSDSPDLTVDILLKQPEVVSRALTSLVAKRIVADKVLAHGDPATVAGGSLRYQRSESIYPDRAAETVADRGEFPRTGWNETVLTADVEQHGLETPITDLTIRRNQRDVFLRSMVKLGNQVAKYVDSLMMTKITTDPAVNTDTASAAWSSSSTDVILDVVEAKKLIDDQDEGYVADTLILNVVQAKELLVHADWRDAAKGLSNGDLQIQNGFPMPLLGLRQVLVTPTLADGTVVLMASGMAGTIVDETPEGQEGYAAWQPESESDVTRPPVWVKSYREERTSTQVIRAVRWPAIYLAEPKAVTVITGA